MATRKSSLLGAQAQMHEQARMRLCALVVLMMIAYLGIIARLVDLSVLRHEAVATNEGVKPLARSLRASIVDRNGVPLAASLKMASVFADPSLVDNPKELARKLAAILPEQTEKDILKKLTSDKRFVWIQRNVTPKQEYAINALGEPALSFQEEDRRIYPNGDLAAHVVGYTDVDGKGIAGAEKFFDTQLKEGGEPVRLTLDLRVQHILHRALSKSMAKFRAKDAIGMVMDVATGEIVAMVSLPDFDPNKLSSATDNQRFNRATLGVFEMGSTFKLFSTAAALESGEVHFSTVYDASQPIKVGPFTISDYHAKKRPLTVPEIFVYSSNIGTARMAAQMGNARMQDFYRGLGFMDQTQLEIPERGTPIYPKPWRDVSTLTTSFGHGIAVSPVHLMRAASALVNGGVLPAATLVMSDTPREEGKRVVSAKTSDNLRKLLELVVVDGTGNNAYVDGYNVGGKTGTAEKNAKGGYEKNMLLSSFLGFFPIDAPRYAVLAILDEPQGTPDTHGYATGGWVAAPVVAQVVSQMGPLYNITPDFSRGTKVIEREMGQYLKEYREGKRLASAGTDH